MILVSFLTNIDERKIGKWTISNGLLLPYKPSIENVSTKIDLTHNISFRTV